MVHTRNASKYSVQLDRSGKGRGKTRARPGRPLSRKTHLEDTRVTPIPQDLYQQPFTLTLSLDVLKVIFLRAEPLVSGSQGDISALVQKLVQRSQGRGVGNLSKSLPGCHKLLLTHQELSGSVEDHRAPRRMESLFLKRQGQKDIELVEEAKSFIHRLKEGTGDDPRFGERRTSSFNKLQTFSRTVQRQAQNTSEATERYQEQSIKGQLAQTLPKRVHDSQIGTFSHGQSVKYGQIPHGAHSQETGKDEKDLFMQIIVEVRYIQSIMDVKINTFDK
ncbi:hypothetical protein O181_047870 [Austropuccinia psidii MF-1]|uniref:Uncharacterized protein n=1 Tax=Austropuccinia psidii MF-1 TaxID=1389203 RepID=A0A9Q3DQZ3_9BASI|nr:hypothetical protein [Austropuccinia psidii MF-1]